MEFSNKYQPYIEKFNHLKDEYEQYFPALFFALGFSFDLFTLGEIDDLINIITQAIYLLVAGHILFTYYCPPKREITNKYLKYYFEYKDDIFHFLLGSLLSAFTIFYFKSASVANSFLFLGLISSLLLLNEIPYFQKLGHLVRSALFMLCLVSFLIYVIPIIFGKTGMLYFLSAALIALLLVLIKSYLFKLNSISPDEILKEFLLPQAIILLLFIILYFSKIIPPVPLSLKHIGIYHDLRKKNNTYITYSNRPWYNFWSNGDQNYLYRKGDKVFVFTKVFAPAGFAGNIYIHWLKDTDDGYKTSDRIPLKVTGGRREGFRGFSYKSNYSEGDWQVRIETEGGLEIGRINISISKDESTEKRRFKKVAQE